MRILFVHNNFPGQYKRIAEHLQGSKNHELLSASLATSAQSSLARSIKYKPHRQPSDQIHPATHYTESAVLLGQGALRSFVALRQTGWKPDIVLAHSGWGNSMFIKDAWPDTKLLSYFEWYYNADGDESTFLRTEPLDLKGRMKVRLKNTPMLHDLAAMDWGQCPTNYQADQFPIAFRDQVTVLHDGIDTGFFSPMVNATFAIGSRLFTKGDPLITYIARGMEPYRGFPQFIEAISRLQKIDAHVHAVVIGEDRVAYGPKRQDGISWKQAVLREYQPDMERLHFLGRQPLSILRNVLRVSAAHVYLTVPFVLSWSMMEAMSTGALVVGSDTPPVRELILDGFNGLLTDFYDVGKLVEKLSDAISSPSSFNSIRDNARNTIMERYTLEDINARYLQLINSVANGHRPQ